MFKKTCRNNFWQVFLFGRGTTTRTLNQWIWSPLLYQLSYTPMYLYLKAEDLKNLVGLQGFEPGTIRL